MACLILNPGSRNGEAAAAALLPLLRQLGDVRMLLTRGVRHGEALAREAAAGGERLIFVAGGDGTLNEVINGLTGYFDQVRLGVLPVGTGNDFARSLGMPADLEGAVAALAAGRTRRCDLVRFRSGDLDRYFANVSAGGFSGEVNETLTPQMKDSWGPLAYFRAALETLPERCAHSVRLVFDDEEVRQEKAFNVAVANGRFVAGGIPVAPYAEIDDGVFDVILIKECSLAAIAGLASKALVGRHLEDSAEEVFFRQARSLDLVSEPPMAFNVDGEVVGERDGRFELVAGALEVIVGPEAAG
ncbi:MAG TPA: diacylglycerol kinase family protein [Thermoanaerobaculia bacterium]|nr:diacylglycerol kinase family protein [Thermoanaerobaculia bacterium]